MINKLKRIAVKTLRMIYIYNEIIVVEKKLYDTDSHAQAKILFDLRFVQKDDFPKVANRLKEFYIDLEKNFKDADICAIAEIDGVIIHLSFVALSDIYVPELLKRIRINSDSAYKHATYTVPEYRGFGIAPKVSEELFIDLNKRGIEKVYSLVMKSNLSSLRYWSKVGARKIGTITSIRICGFKYYRIKGITKAYHNILTNIF